MTLTVQKTESLYCKYAGQHAPQGCHLELDGDAVRANYDEFGNGTPIKVWNGQVKRWSLPCLRPAVVDTLIQDLLPLLERVAEGLEIYWDGNNHRGRFSDDASEASEEIDSECQAAFDREHEHYKVWSASDWYSGIGSVAAQCVDLEITAASTDEDLEKLAESEAAALDPSMADEVEGVEEHLIWLRDELRAEESEIR